MVETGSGNVREPLALRVRTVVLVVLAEMGLRKVAL